MRRFWVYGVLVLVAGVFGFQLYQTYTSEKVLNGQFQKIKSQTEALINDNKGLNQQIDYYSNAYNLEKKLRSQTDYRLPNEKLIITTPKQ